MTNNFWVIIGVVSFGAFFLYLGLLIAFIFKFIRASYIQKKFDIVALKELLTVVFLGGYGLYIIEKNKEKVNGKSDMYLDKARNGYIIFSILTLIWVTMIIIPKTDFASKDINSFFEKDYYQTYYKASLVALDDDFSPISPEIVAISEVEHDDGSYWVGNVYVENMGTYHAYSSDPFGDFGEGITITDIDGKNYKVRIFDEKPEFRVVKDLYTNVAGVTFDNDGTSRQDILEKVKSGIKHINLIRDKENQYDKNAVIVHSYYGRIGYIKADLAPYVASILDNGGIVRATVSEVTGGKDGQNYGCNLYIEVLKQVR